jgi:hypothetical protein
VEGLGKRGKKVCAPLKKIEQYSLVNAASTPARPPEELRLCTGPYRYPCRKKSLPNRYLQSPPTDIS